MSGPLDGAGRLASLDAFRGFAIAGMVLVNNPGSWAHVYAPLAHAEWHGCTFTDLIFPFFLFAAGLSLHLSLGSADGSERGLRYRRLLRRATLLFLIGLLLNLIPDFAWGTVRIPGVLQRIALTLVLGAPLVLWGGRLGPFAGILFGCGLWLALTFGVPVPGVDGGVAVGRLAPGQDLGAWLDRFLLGPHLWAQARTWDPEGLLGTLPATANLLLGVVAGRFLTAGGGRKAPRLAGAGLALLALGGVAGATFLPLNKSLWTPSYACFTGGWSLLVLAAFHAALDEAPARFRDAARRLCLPLSIFGLNALFLFVASGLLGRLLQSVHPGGAGGPTLKAALFSALAAWPISPRNASLAFAVGFELLMFALAWALWRKRWVVKV